MVDFEERVFMGYVDYVLGLHQGNGQHKDVGGAANALVRSPVISP